MDIYLSKKREGILSPPILYNNGKYDFIAKNVSNLTEALVEYKKHYGNLKDLDLRLSSDNKKDNLWKIMFSHLSNSDFSGTLFDRCDFVGDNMNSINFSNTSITNSVGVINANNCIFDNCNMRHNDFFLFNFCSCTFIDANIDYNFLCNLEILDEYKNHYKKDYKMLTLISDLNLKSFNGNELKDNIFIPNINFKNEKVKYYLNKYAENYTALAIALTTLPASALLAHYGYISSGLSHSLNYIGYGYLAGKTIKNNLKNNSNRLYDKTKVAISFFANKLKNEIFKKNDLDYNHYFHSNNKELLDDIEKLIDSMPDKDATFTSKYKDLNIIFISENNFLQVMNLLIKSKKNYIGQDNKPFILINDNCKDSEIQSFVKTQNEYIFIEKGEPNKIYTFDINKLNDQFYLLVDKTIKDFGEKYKKTTNQDFYDSFDCYYPYNQETHFLLKNNEGYYIINMDTLINENGSAPCSIVQVKDYDKNFNRIVKKDVYNIYYADKPTQTLNVKNVKDILNEDSRLTLKL